MTPQQLQKVTRLIALATSAGTPETEARTSAVLACRLLQSAGGLEELAPKPPPPGTTLDPRTQKAIHKIDAEVKCSKCGRLELQEHRVEVTLTALSSVKIAIEWFLDDLPPEGGWLILCHRCSSKR